MVICLSNMRLNQMMVRLFLSLESGRIEKTIKIFEGFILFAGFGYGTLKPLQALVF